MPNFTLEKEDIRNINCLFGEILGCCGSLDYENFLIGKTNFEKNYIDTDINDFPNRRKQERFSFFTRVEAGFSLFTMFRDIYTAKYIAKQVYCLDEDERFDVEFDAGIPLGIVEDKKGQISVTSVVKAVIKVRNKEKRNADYGMPFDLIGFQLIPDYE